LQPQRQVGQATGQTQHVIMTPLAEVHKQIGLRIRADLGIEPALSLH
jgi:hypothetical protein